MWMPNDWEKHGLLLVIYYKNILTFVAKWFTIYFKCSKLNYKIRKGELFMKKPNNPLIIMPFSGGKPGDIPPDPPKF